MSVRVKAYCQKANKTVNVTLRKPVLDLTDKNLRVSAYTHINGKTVSGYLTVGATERYVFS